MKNANKKLVIVTIIALVLAVSCVVGTLAYLTAQTTEITNTFTVGKVAITLVEYQAGTDTPVVNNEQEYASIKPAQVLDKDATITVEGDSEDCYLYIKVAVAGNVLYTDDDAKDDVQVLSWEMEEGWTLVDGTTDVYYREVNKADGTKSFGIIKNDTVTVNGALTSEDCAEISGLSITLTGYAVQKEGLNSAKAAWDATFGA